MAQRLYIVPEVLSNGALVAKYLDQLGPYGPAASMRYGFQPIRLVGADFTASQDAFLVAQPDVFAFPFDLTQTVGGGGVQAARDALELVLIPSQWVQGNMTWMVVAKTVAGMFQFMNVLKNILPVETVLIDNSAKLNIQWSSIPTETQNAVIAAAQLLGYDTAFIQANTQLRTILQNFANAWGIPPIFVGPVVLQ